jgi:hypothetical protein
VYVSPLSLESAEASLGLSSVMLRFDSNFLTWLMFLPKIESLAVAFLEESPKKFT